jgi:hypothetical protein
MMDIDQDKPIEFIPLPPDQAARDFREFMERLYREITDQGGIKKNHDN